MMKGNYDFVFNIGDTSKGIADNPYMLKDGAIVDCAGADIRNFLPETGKAKACVEAFTTNGKEMYCGIDNLFFGEDGHGYNTSGTNFLVTGQNDDILGCTKYNGRYLMFDDNGSSPRISKIDVDDVNGSTDRTSELSRSLNRIPTDWDTYRKNQGNSGVSTLLYQGNLYFTNDDQVLILDENDTVFQGLKCPSEVVAISVYGSMIKIYCDNGQILYWDGLDGNSWNESIDLGQPIFGVGGKAGKDHIFAGDDSGGLAYMYEMNGYSITPITEGQKSYMSVRLGGETSQHSISNVDGLIYFPGGLATEGVYTYGSAFPGIEPSLCYEFDITSTGYKFSQIYMIREYGNVVYISYQDTEGTVKMDKISSSTVGTVGYITSEALGDRMSSHSIEGLELKAHGRVLIQYKYNSEDPTDFNRKESINGGRIDWIDSDDHVYENNIIRIHGIDADLPDFRDIQFKITFYDTFGILNVYGQYVGE